MRCNTPKVSVVWLIVFKFLFVLAVSAQDTPVSESSTSDASQEISGIEFEIPSTEESGEPHPGEAAYWDAMIIFDGPEPRELEAGREFLLDAADEGFSPAQNMLGACYLMGLHGFSTSNRRAANWFELAAESGDGYAMVNLARCYIAGQGVWKSRRKAKAWLLRAMEEAVYPSPIPPEAYSECLVESAETAVNLLSTTTEDSAAYKARINAASMLFRLFENEKEEEESFKYALMASGFDKKSTNGNYGAAISAAIALAFGEGTEKDRNKAEELLEFSKKLVKNQAMQFAHSLTTAKVLDNLAMGEIEKALQEVADESMATLELRIASKFSDEDSDEVDMAEAIPWFELAADSGKEWAMLRLAFLYNNKDSDLYDPEKVFRWFKEAAEEGNHTLGWFNLGNCYYNGIGTTRDVDAAMKAYGETENHYGCYLALNGSPPSGILTYDEELELNKDATKGRDPDPHAIYLYARRHWYGYGVDADVGKAYSLFSKAAKKGHAEAMYSMGQDYYYGYDHSRNYEKAYELFVKADEMGSENAPFKLGYMNDMGVGCKEDKLEAERYYRKSMELVPDGSSVHNNLATIFEAKLKKYLKENPSKEVVTVPKVSDKKGVFGDKAIELKSSKKGYSDGSLFKEGESITEEFDNSDKYFEEASAELLRSEMCGFYEKAIELKSAKAAYNYGKLFMEGELVPKDYKKAYKYFQDATEGGNSDAYYFLGKMHDEGMGFEVTPQEAAYNYRMAAVNEDTFKRYRMRAMGRLIFFYRYGVGFPRDLERALFWSSNLADIGSTMGWKQSCDLLIDLERYEDVLKILKQLVYSDNEFIKGHAYARLSELYGLGHGVKKSESRQERYLKRSVELNSAYGYFLAGLYYSGIKDFESAVTSFMVAARSSSFKDDRPEGCELEYKGNTIQFRMDAASELPDALYKLGCMLYGGQGLPEDKEKAWEMFLMAGRLGSSEAQFNIGVATLKGNPQAPSLDDAIELLQMAVNVNHPKAEQLLNLLLEKLDKERAKELEEKKENEPDSASGIFMEIT